MAPAAALYVSDLAIFPVQAERLTWISALDTHPMVSLESKRELLGRAVAEGWLTAVRARAGPAAERRDGSYGRGQALAVRAEHSG